MRRAARHEFAKGFAWRAAELDRHFGCGDGQVFAGADVDRHAFPSPAFDEQPHGDIGLNGRAWPHAGNVAIAAILARARRRPARSGGPPSAGLLSGRASPRFPRPLAGPWQDAPGSAADGSAARRGWRPSHRRSGPVLHAEILGHGDLDAAHMVAGSRSARTSDWRSAYRAGFAPAPCPGNGRCERCFLRESSAATRSLSFLAEARSWPNGFSITRRASCAALDFARALGHDAEHTGRHGQVVQRRAFASPSSLVQFLEGRRVRIVAVDVAQQRQQFILCFGIDRRRDAPDCPWHAPSVDRGSSRTWRRRRSAHPIPRRAPSPAARKDLLIGQVAGGAEEDERIGWSRPHCHHCVSFGFSTCPPNSKRSAESSRSA